MPNKIPPKRTGSLQPSQAKKRGRYYGHKPPQTRLVGPPLPADLQSKFERLLLTPLIQKTQGAVKIPAPPRDPHQLAEWIVRHENSYEHRKEMLKRVIEELTADDHINLLAVYDALERAKHADFEATLCNQGLDWTRDHVTERTLIHGGLTRWAKEAIRFHQRLFTEGGIDPRPWTSPYEKVLKALSRDPLLNPSPIFPDGRHRREHAGRPARPWIAKARQDLAQAGVPKSMREKLLRATRLIPEPPSDL